MTLTAPSDRLLAQPTTLHATAHTDRMRTHTMSQLKMPYACKLAFHELQSMNIVPRLRLSDL